MHYDEKRKAIVITEVPYSVTTGDLRESIIKAFEKGKIKIKKVEDYTASEAEVVVFLPSGVSPDQTIDALYAFTQCQISFSPQTCVIVDNKPVFMTISDILRHSTMRTRDLLRQELEIQLEELNERWYWVSLEKIFFEKGIYKKMEKKDSSDWEEQVDDMHKAFGPYKKKLKREVTRDDVLKLTEKPVKKISKFDIKKAAEEIEEIEMNMDEVKNHLAHLTDYAISYFKHILEKYGKGRDRKTEIRNFEDIQAATVAVANEIKDLYGDEKDDLGNRWFIGEPISVIYDYEMEGIWQEDEIAAGKHLNQDPQAQAGDVKLKDQNGDGKIDPNDDKVIQGQTTPKWTAGLTNTFSYKGFTLSIFIQTAQGQKRNNSLLAMAADEQGRRNSTTEVGYWTPENKSDEYRSLSKTSNRWGYGFPRDASYTRIKDVTLSYAFPTQITNLLHLSSLTAYVSGRNLYTFTSWKGWDPEADITQRGWSGYENNYPMTKSFVFGLNVTF